MTPRRGSSGRGFNSEERVQRRFPLVRRVVEGEMCFGPQKHCRQIVEVRPLTRCGNTCVLVSRMMLICLEPRPV